LEWQLHRLANSLGTMNYTTTYTGNSSLRHRD